VTADEVGTILQQIPKQIIDLEEWYQPAGVKLIERACPLLSRAGAC
jgi:hypothetical protein